MAGRTFGAAADMNKAENNNSDKEAEPDAFPRTYLAHATLERRPEASDDVRTIMLHKQKQPLESNSSKRT